MHRRLRKFANLAAAALALAVTAAGGPLSQLLAVAEVRRSAVTGTEAGHTTEAGPNTKAGPTDAVAPEYRLVFAGCRVGRASAPAGPTQDGAADSPARDDIRLLQALPDQWRSSPGPDVEMGGASVPTHQECTPPACGDARPTLPSQPAQFALLRSHAPPGTRGPPVGGRDF